MWSVLEPSLKLPKSDYVFFLTPLIGDDIRKNIILISFHVQTQKNWSHWLQWLKINKKCLKFLILFLFAISMHLCAFIESFDTTFFSPTFLVWHLWFSSIFHDMAFFNLKNAFYLLEVFKKTSFCIKISTFGPKNYNFGKRCIKEKMSG